MDGERPDKLGTPTLIFPPGQQILQNAWVVNDLYCTIERWLTLGVGPFFVHDIDIEDSVLHGRRSPLRCSLALAQAGGVQIELIQPENGTPSAWRHSVPEGVSALHHVMKLSKDWDDEMAALRVAGVPIISETATENLRFAYVDTRAAIGCMLEIVEDAPLIRSINSTVAAAAIGWTGRDPVRRLQDYAQ